MRKIKFYSLLLACLFVFNSSAATQRELAVDLLSRLSELKQQIGQEKNQWSSEQKTLELELKLLHDSAQLAQEKRLEFEKKLTELKQDKKKLLSSLEQVKKSVVQLNLVLDKSRQDITERLHKRNPAGVKALLKSQMKELHEAKAIDEKIASQRNYLVALVDLQKQIHRFTESLDVNGQGIQATVIYLGTVSGYYITEDQSACGVLKYEAGGWKAVSDPRLRESIALALAQMERTGKPRLVDLPMQLQGVSK